MVDWSGRRGATRGCFRRRTFSWRRRFTHDRAKIAKECGALQRTLHEDAAAIEGIDFTTGEIEFTQAIERAGDCRLRNVKFGGEPAHGMPAVAQVAGEEHTELTS